MLNTNINTNNTNNTINTINTLNTINTINTINTTINTNNTENEVMVSFNGMRWWRGLESINQKVKNREVRLIFNSNGEVKATLLNGRCNISVDLLVYSLSDKIIPENGFTIDLDYNQLMNLLNIISNGKPNYDFNCKLTISKLNEDKAVLKITDEKEKVGTITSTRFGCHGNSNFNSDITENIKIHALMYGRKTQQIKDITTLIKCTPQTKKDKNNVPRILSEGVKIELKNNYITLTSTDGFRFFQVHYYQLFEETDSSFSATLSLDALKALKKIIGNCKNYRFINISHCTGNLTNRTVIRIEVISEDLPKIVMEDHMYADEYEPTVEKYADEIKSAEYDTVVKLRKDEIKELLSIIKDYKDSRYITFLINPIENYGDIDHYSNVLVLQIPDESDLSIPVGRILTPIGETTYKRNFNPKYLIDVLENCCQHKNLVNRLKFRESTIDMTITCEDETTAVILGMRINE